MVYQLVIPAKFAAGFAAGKIALMTTATGATTTLVAGGQIVGVATLAEVGSVGAAGGAVGTSAAGVGGVAGASILLPVLVGVAGIAAVGALIYWLLSDKPTVDEADVVVIDLEATTPEEAADVLRRAEAIIDAEYGRRAADDPGVQIRRA